MLTFLFWNLNKKPLHALVAELADSHEVDILVLAECAIVSPIMLNELNSRQSFGFSLTFSASDRIVIYTRFPSHWLTPITDEDGLSIRHLIHPILDQELLIIAAHLSSRLHRSGEELNQLATRLGPLIEEAEESVGHSRTVLVGDLNMSPFDTGVASSEGLHGVMDRRIVERVSRKVNGRVRRLFYNPMWSRLGDESLGPAGTYYYNSSSSINHFWHTFDQVLVRPDLLPYFRNEEKKVITEVGTRSLMDDSGRPSGQEASDHFPLLFRLTF